MPELDVRTPLTDLLETVSSQERDDLPGLEHRQVGHR